MIKKEKPLFMRGLLVCCFWRKAMKLSAIEITICLLSLFTILAAIIIFYFLAKFILHQN
jgi:hypothetical protein